MKSTLKALIATIATMSIVAIILWCCVTFPKQAIIVLLLTSFSLLFYNTYMLFKNKFK